MRQGQRLVRLHEPGAGRGQGTFFAVDVPQKNKTGGDPEPVVQPPEDLDALFELGARLKEFAPTETHGAHVEEREGDAELVSRAAPDREALVQVGVGRRQFAKLRFGTPEGHEGGATVDHHQRP